MARKRKDAISSSDEGTPVVDFREVTHQLQREFNYKVLGQHMKSVRNSRHMTQAQVAEAMHLGVKYYASIETGTIKISLMRLIQFINLMQVSADSLLTGCHENYPSEKTDREYKCIARHKLEALLDQCSDETIETVCIITEALMKPDR